MLVELTVSRNDAGQRAERYLRRRLPALSLDRLQSLFRRKEIKIARKPIQRNHPLQDGDLIQVYGLRPEDVSAGHGGDSGAGGSVPTAARERVLGIPILHEDADLLVLDKPAGLAVHPGTGIAEGESVIEKARAYLAGDRDPGELFQPSLVHRLDKDTSGVLVIAKTGGALRKLTEALRNGGFHKRYLALVEGEPEPAEGEISGKLQRVDSRSGGAKAEVSQEDGKWSVTRYRTVKHFGKFSLLGVIIETGRMHQIRAHLSSRGHALVGDPRYGSFERNRTYRKSLGLKRTFLHAADLEIDSGRGALRFHAPLPKDLSAVLERIPGFVSGAA